MWRRALGFLLLHPTFRSQPSIFSSTRLLSSNSDTQALYSFLQPSIFSLRKPSPHSASAAHNPDQLPPPNLHQTVDKAALENELQASLEKQSIDEAWKAFKALTAHSLLPGKHLANSLITSLSCFNDAHNLKRAFAALVFILERKPNIITAETVRKMLETMRKSNMLLPAFAAVRSMLKNLFYIEFGIWGPVLVELARKNGNLVALFRVLEEVCEVIGRNKSLGFMKPDIEAFNAALEGCTCESRSVGDAEAVLDMMSAMGVMPDGTTFALMGFVYASEGLVDKIADLDQMMKELGISPDQKLYGSLIRGYLRSGDLEAVEKVVLCAVRQRVSSSVPDGNGEVCQKQISSDSLVLDEETYSGIVKGFLGMGRIRDLARLIEKSQDLEQGSFGTGCSVGSGIINGCVELGMLDKAHSIVDEMNALGATVGIGVYTSILKAYCREHRTAEAAQLVGEISSSGLRLDESSYDALIDVAMTTQDFQSAFSLFRDMREARMPNLKTSYLTIMTGLTENHRPELMASFLDEVVTDPRVEVGTHDWNSIIHSFCKLGRLEDARRTLRRMVFLRFEPNEQTYLSLVHGYSTAEKYFSVLMLWTQIRKRPAMKEQTNIKFDHNLIDAFLYALIKGGFFDAAMQVVEKAQEMKIFVDKWRYKQAFMESHKKLKLAKIRKKSFRKLEALISFKNWVGLNA
ncbi:pentatricopeptide repeat-containing protein At1g69290 [Nymphaea colorata]|uniref:At1g68980-like TPR repeats domain-containing protein n=1 Tax=Nymphaea colorata TaxID=210225 RepID=A0A5K0XUF5_9MAGN|nr:pentatricopeptide repeat-containing protein At1g69290 [Nymphaea colorata]